MPTVTPAAVNIAAAVQAPSVYSRVSPAAVGITATVQGPTTLAIAAAVPGLGYEVKLSTLGSSVVTLTNAQPRSASWERSGPGSFEYVMHTLDTQAPLNIVIEREAQLWRDNRHLFSGPLMVADADADAVTFRCVGLAGYFGQRHIDRGADRLNFLTNPEFEASPDLTGWTAVGTTAIAATDRKITGTRSARLTQANADVVSYLRQTVVKTAGSLGELVTAVAWFYISPTGWVGPAYEGRGLRLSRTVGGNTVGEIGVADINNDTPRGAWQRAEVTVHMPPNATETLELRLYSPGGVIYWDAASLTLMESLSRPGVDQATIAADVVEFLQGRYTGFAGLKSDLLISTNAPASGVVRDRTFQFADHVNGETALGELAGLDNGIDYEVTPGRVFKTHYPSIGTDRTATLTLDESNSIVRRYVIDGHAAASAVVVLGEGDGPDREEGGAGDAALFGGRNVEKVISPNGTAAIDALDELAAQELANLRNPKIVELTITDRALIGVVGIGDKVTLALTYGFMALSGAWTIEELSLDCTADVLSATLNVAP